MAKTKKSSKARDAYPKLPAQQPAKAAQPQTHAVRETVESIVIAFVLAFLFRTFEAEAFVIPTGSMAPTLMGRHKDVECPKCGYRYQVSASEEESDDPQVAPTPCVAGMCPMCKYVLPMVPQLPNVPERLEGRDIDRQRSYNGDRILVNKYIYAFSEPERWDVVVFKFPGDAKVNYIKRLVGLPGETLRVYQGDLFVGDAQASDDGDFQISAKPADKVLSLRQLVHDTEYDPAELFQAGWPLRWSITPAENGGGWQRETTVEGTTVRQRYTVDGGDDSGAWIRYEHRVPDYGVWRRLAQLAADTPADQPIAFSEADLESAQRRLITDANPYNGRLVERDLIERNGLRIDPTKQGLHWVGDLMLEADVEVLEARGELLLDLVEAGRHFRCAINLTNGEATLSAEGVADLATAKTPIAGAGEYRVAFANVDDQLLLWVDGDLVAFEGGTAYDVDNVFGDRRQILPQTSEEDPGDLAPAGVGARDAKLAVTRLQMWRDIYYIAASSKNARQISIISDFNFDLLDYAPELPARPENWNLYSSRRQVDFRMKEDQFFVMGDNSAESSDARLWSATSKGGRPGGDYLERRLLIGKALCVYWPHSWHRIPGTPIPFPFFPNFEDMRLVR
ncbi:MAG TPA: signal peptidase I [Lacipirellulaceae bacterium]|nr:signal peptidase I [Lacipirellulaceae bacterium]